MPLVYRFAPDFTVLDKAYLGDADAVAAKMSKVAAQGKAEPKP